MKVLADGARSLAGAPEGVSSSSSPGCREGEAAPFLPLGVDCCWRCCPARKDAAPLLVVMVAMASLPVYR